MALVGASLLTACGDGSPATAPESPWATAARESGTPPPAALPAAPSAAPLGPTPQPVAPTRTEEYLPGLAADVYEPPAPASGTLVVLIPGGGWSSADRSGLAPLAAALAGTGMTVVSATYGTSGSDAFYPAPLEDVACAVAFAAARAIPTGVDADRVVVVGHSAGANLAALAALAPERTSTGCPYPAIAPDAFAALAGPYDVARLPWIAVSLFGVSPREDPDLWVDGNPLTHAGSRPEVPALLLHGRDDALVPVSFTTEFAAALESGGHQVMVDVVAGADHSGIYRVDVAADRLADWIAALP